MSAVLPLPPFSPRRPRVAHAEDQVPLKTDLPKPLFVGTPVPIKVPNLEPPQKGKRPDFLVPAGTTNLSLKQKSHQPATAIRSSARSI